jgi:hypothetical protein
VVVALVGGLFIVSRGGDERQSERTRAALRQLNGVCLARNKKAASEFLQAYDDPRVKRANSEREAIDLEVKLFVPILLADAEAQARAIRNTDMPSDGEEQVEAILDAYRGWIDRTKQAPLKSVMANDVYNEARDLARSHGLLECGVSPYEVRIPPSDAQTAQTY